MKLRVWTLGCFLGCSLTLLAQSTNRLLWQVPTGGYVFSSPAVTRDGTIYIGSADRRLYALDSAGAIKWTFLTGGEIQSSPAVARDGTIYFGSADKNLYALRPDGSKKWAFLTGDVILCSPTLGADGTIYIGSRDGTFYAVDKDGTQKWVLSTGEYANDMPAVIGPEGTIFMSAGGTIYAMKHNGNKRWQQLLGDSDFGLALAIGPGGALYATMVENGPGRTILFALTRHGEKLWQFASGQMTVVVPPSFPAIGSDGTIYFGTADSTLYAIRPDGSLKWSTAAPRTQSSPALGDDGNIYLNDGFNFALLCYNSAGALQWTFPMEILPGSASGYFASFPTLGQGVVYVGSGNGRIYAIRASGELASTAWPAFGRDLEHTGRDLQRGIEATIDPVTRSQKLRVSVEIGKRYTIQSSSDLRTWQDSTTFEATGPMMTFPRPPNHSHYRLVAH